MPLDLPAPLPAPAAIVSQATLTATLAGGERLEVVGASGLSQARVQAAVASTRTPAQAARSLRQAYGDAGFVLVGVRARKTGGTPQLVVTLGRFAQYQGPDRFRPYFAGVLTAAELRSSDVVTAATRAQTSASRYGQYLDVREGRVRDPMQSVLVVTPRPVKGWRPVGATFTVANYGNRYAGRDIGTMAVRTNPGGNSQLDLSGAKRIDHISDHNEGADYESGGAVLSFATRWGTYGARGDLIDYRTGENQRRNLPTGSEGEIRTAGVFGEQLLYADRNKAWYVNEAVTRASNRLQISDDFRLFDQDYTYLNLGTLFQTAIPWSERARFTSRLWVTQGLGGDFDNISAPIPLSPPPPPGSPPFLVIGGGLGIINLNNLLLVGGGLGDIILDLDDDPVAGVEPRTASGGVIRKPKDDFRVAGLSLEYSHPLPSNVEVAASLSGQYTGNTMPNLQQFVLGGFGNLTGWVPGVAAGDRGGVARVGITRSEIPLAGLKFTLGSYVEAGAVEVANPFPGAQGWQSVADAGVAVTGQAPFGTRATFAYAQPIASKNVRSQQRDDTRADLYFQLEQRL